MIEISQHKQNIIGSREAIAALENKDHARLLVLSDSHGRYGIMESIVRGFGGKCDALIFCGDGVCDIGMASRALKDSEIEAGLTPMTIAMDGIAVIVSNDNPVDGLTSEQVRNIYMGEITDWSEVDE